MLRRQHVCNYHRIYTGVKKFKESAYLGIGLVINLGDLITDIPNTRATYHYTAAVKQLTIKSPTPARLQRAIVFWLCSEILYE